MHIHCEICGIEIPPAKESEKYLGICTNCEKELEEDEETELLIALDII